MRSVAVALAGKENRATRPKPELAPPDDGCRKPTPWTSRPKGTQRLALRTRIVPACADEPSNTAVTAELGVCSATVGIRRDRFVARRLDGLTDETRNGTPRTVAGTQVEAAAAARTLETEPADATRWSDRAVAKAAGLSQSAVGGIRRDFELEPHRHGTVELSTDSFFAEKVRDIVGLSMSPQEHAIVPSVDETGRVRALVWNRHTGPIVDIGHSADQLNGRPEDS